MDEQDSVAFSTSKLTNRYHNLCQLEDKRIHHHVGIYGGATTRMTVSNGDYELPVPTKFDYKLQNGPTRTASHSNYCRTRWRATLHCMLNGLKRCNHLLDGNDTTHMTANNSKYTLQHQRRMTTPSSDGATNEGIADSQLKMCSPATPHCMLNGVSWNSPSHW